MSAEKIYQRFEAAVIEWRTKLGLNSWRIALIELETEESASCIADPTYKQIDLGVNTKRILSEEYSDLQIESTALHELVHARLWICFDQLINPAVPEDLATFHEERLTEVMTASLLRAKYPDRIDEINNLWAEFLVTREHAVNQT